MDVDKTGRYDQAFSINLKSPDVGQCFTYVRDPTVFDSNVSVKPRVAGTIDYTAVSNQKVAR
jgi:hypothetical protein